MILSPPHYDDPRHPSLYDGLTGWAVRARPRVLAGISVGAGLAWAALVLLDWRHGPIGGVLLSASAVAIWGLLEQRAATPHSRMIALAELLLVVLGTATAVVSLFAALFWVMGPAPVL